MWVTGGWVGGRGVSEALWGAVFIAVFSGVMSGMVLMFWVMDHERMPWQHQPKCPCGKCFAARMKRAVEQAEYERQQDDIYAAVQEVQQSTRRGR
jgi:hypothetical protein